MNNNDAYFQKLGFESELAWESERQDRCDDALDSIKKEINSDAMKDPDNRRVLFVRMHALFHNWIDWIDSSQTKGGGNQPAQTNDGKIAIDVMG